MKNISAEEQKEVENSIREHIWDVGFPMEYFIFNINDFSIDFLREIDRKVIKAVIMCSKEWYVDEEYNFEKHFKRCFPKLKEFWREMIK